MAGVRGQVVVITGGAGPNVGRELSAQLADAGATAVILDIDTENGVEIVEAITARGGDAQFIETDVTDVGAINEAIESVIERYGRINAVINNAGCPAGVTMEEIDEEAFDADIALNLKSAFFTTKAALPHLKESRGSVVFVSSVNALLGGFSEVGYASAKGGLHSLCRSLVADHSPDGIRFNVITLGSVIGESSVWEQREHRSPGTMERIADAYPLGRYGDPEDVAHVVEFLISEKAAWINGIVMPVDGGLTATGNLPGGRWWEEL